MSKVIKSLTKEQEQYMEVFREQKRKESLSTERLNREKSASDIRNLYEVVGHDAPKYILYFDSPIQCLMARTLMMSETFNKHLPDDEKELNEILQKIVSQIRLQALNEKKDAA